MSSEKENELIAQNIQAAAEAFSFCQGVLQRYFAYLQGGAEDMFGEVQPSNEVSFLDGNKRQWSMKLDLVDDWTYNFPLEKCPGAVVRATMDRIKYNLRLVANIMLANINVELSRPELFKNSVIQCTPSSTFFLYNQTHGRELHDSFKKRIAFVWTQEGVEPDIATLRATEEVRQEERLKVTVSQGEVVVPVPHADNFSGARGQEISDAEASQIMAEINRGRCRVCGGPEECDCLN